MNGADTLLAGLAARGRNVLGQTLGTVDRYALVDFPNHTNVGDSAIWLGELQALSDLGYGPPAYVCDLDTYSPERLRERVGQGPVLIHGGGNFGDLWPRHQRFRETVIADHPDRRVIQLPQSVQFETAAALDRARAVCDDHPDLTLLLRDRRSLERARGSFAAKTDLCPDLAVCLPAHTRAIAPTTPELWLLREDHEAVPDRTPTNTGSRTVVDWLDEPPAAPPSGVAARGLAEVRRVVGTRGGPLSSWNPAARARLARGFALLSRGEIVVTDRLHAHILCLLSGIPHVVLPDRFGKIEHFLETWTGGSELVVFAPSRDRVEPALRRLRARGVGEEEGAEA